MSVCGFSAIDALLFDLGNVVIGIDFHRMCLAWARDADCDPELMKERFFLDEFYMRHERGEIDAAEYFDSLRNLLGIDLTDEQFLAGWNSIYVGEEPGIRSVLRRARKYLPLYAFTNTNPAHEAQWSVQFEDLLEPFVEIFTSCRLGARKPDPRAYLLVAETISLAPDRILFFDDVPENVDGARQAGMRAVHVTSVSDIEGALVPVCGDSSSFVGSGHERRQDV